MSTNCDLIVECCQNHNGSWAVLERMVHAAVEAGGKYIKIQSIWTEDLVRRERFEAGDPQHQPYPIIKRPYAPEFERLSKLELSQADQEKFVELCEQLGAVPMTTAFSWRRVATISQMGFKWLKIASYDCGSQRLLEEAAKHFSNIVVSTGASLDQEIEDCVKLLGDRLKGLLHCVTIYPTPLEETNLARMNWLRRFTSAVGLSDHSKPADVGLIPSKCAMLHGARWIERHYTVLEPHESRDGPVSITPAQVAELVQFARNPVETDELRRAAAAVLGRPDRELSITEWSNRDYYRGRFAAHQDGRVVYNFMDD